WRRAGRTGSGVRLRRVRAQGTRGRRAALAVWTRPDTNVRSQLPPPPAHRPSGSRPQVCRRRLTVGRHSGEPRMLGGAGPPRSPGPRASWYPLRAKPAASSPSPTDPAAPPPAVSDVIDSLRTSAGEASRLVATTSGYRAGLLASIAASCTASYTVALVPSGPSI
ncbi:LOW QUALITY PROTEIN: predicted protein, partial [Mycobacterium tuberculosis EAS054]